MNKDTSVVTVKDIARLCGVSRGTVDRALNNRGGISEKTKSLILQTAKEIGFIKNQNAAALSMGRSRLIGVIVFTLNSEFFTALVSSVQKEAQRLGYSVLIMITDYSAEKEAECAERLVSMSVCGLIVCSVMTDPALYESIIRRGIRVITVMNRLGNLPFVGIDDKSAMYESARLVISKGYRRLYYVSPVLSKKNNQNIYAQTGRYDGFCRAISESPSVSVVLIDDYDKYARMTDKIRGESLCAVICSSDSYTVDCIMKLRDTKTGIMGFDRMRILEKLYPSLACVHCPTESVGENAVSLLFSGNAPGTRMNDLIIPFDIIDGDSITIR